MGAPDTKKYTSLKRSMTKNKCAPRGTGLVVCVDAGLNVCFYVISDALDVFILFG